MNVCLCSHVVVDFYMSSIYLYIYRTIPKCFAIKCLKTFGRATHSKLIYLISIGIHRLCDAMLYIIYYTFLAYRVCSFKVFKTFKSDYTFIKYCAYCTHTRIYCIEIQWTLFFYLFHVLNSIVFLSVECWLNFHNSTDLKTFIISNALLLRCSYSSFFLFSFFFVRSKKGAAIVKFTVLKIQFFYFIYNNKGSLCNPYIIQICQKWVSTC